MQTINTKFKTATAKGSRIVATASGNAGRVIVPYDHALNMEENHQAAAADLCRKLDWCGTLYGGDTKTGMVWVFAEDAQRLVIAPEKWAVEYDGIGSLGGTVRRLFPSESRARQWAEQVGHGKDSKIFQVID